jgi:hypothetical protein
MSINKKSFIKLVLTLKFGMPEFRRRSPKVQDPGTARPTPTLVPTYLRDTESMP